MSLNDLMLKLKGGPGSGNHGHSGRPGKRGGSSSSGGTSLPQHLTEIWENAPKDNEEDFMSYLFEQAGNKKIDINDASVLQSKFQGVSENTSPGSPNNELAFSKEIQSQLTSLDKLEERWLKGADPEAKHEITSFYKDFPDVREARLRMLHDKLDPSSSYQNFLDKPITVYRGGRPEYGETFSNFTLSKSTAESFADKRGSGLFELKIKPSNILGYAPTGASEIFVQEDLPDGSSPRANRIDV